MAAGMRTVVVTGWGGSTDRIVATVCGAGAGPCSTTVTRGVVAVDVTTVVDITVVVAIVVETTVVVAGTPVVDGVVVGGGVAHCWTAALQGGPPSVVAPTAPSTPPATAMATTSGIANAAFPI